ncbi:hypothetical protein M3181_02720 [Mesobacillus maritimus]|uniref:hypothetical protein n=1 Tax=Mesobacillus maritimus TaxID=1643336 RepID=UPI0020414AE6|nr:hypothetical protein [Mesobacillus maritimus]MCM3667914.1 hypothetical protein [Mesobacillus maritimus]
MANVLEKNIEWINYLDTLYTSNSVNRNNQLFYYYPNLEINIESDNIDLIYRKQEKKTQFLFGDLFGRRVYLSDIDIINLIVKSNEKVYSVICDILRLYIKDPQGEDVIFKINGQNFYYKSIVSENYDQNKLEILRKECFETSADLSIKYIDLVTLMSLIINKEFLVDVFRENNRILRQSKKFLILSNFYREQLFHEELQRLGYDTSKKIEDVYYNNYAKHLDVIFEKITL